MTESNSPVRLDTIEKFVSLVELERMEVMQVSGEVKPQPSDKDSNDPFRLNFAPSFAAKGFKTRFKIELSTATAVYISDIAAIWTFDQTVRFQAPVFMEFAERVGFMAVYPYLRESIATTASRLDQPIPTLGLIRAGNFALDMEIEGLQEVMDSVVLEDSKP